MDVSKKMQEAITEELLAYRSGDTKAITDICMTLDPLVRAVARRWKEDAVVETQDVEQELRMLLIELIDDLDDEKEGNEFVRIFISACKRKMGRIEAEDTGLSIPYSTKLRKKRSAMQGTDLPTQCSLNALEEKAQKNGSGRKAYTYAGPAAPKDPQKLHEEKEAHEALTKAIELLPREERLVTEMRLNNMSVKRMIEELGIPEYTVYRRIHSAEGHITDRLSAWGYTAADFFDD